MPGRHRVPDDQQPGTLSRLFGRHQSIRLRESAAVLDRTADNGSPWPLGEADVSNTAWSTYSQSDYTDAQWRAACVLHLDPADGQADSKSLHKLPIKQPDGVLNRNGVHAAAQRLGQTDAPADKKKAAAKALISAYSTLGEDPPQSLKTAAGVAESASPARVGSRLTLVEAGTGGSLKSSGGRRYRARLIEGDRWGSSGYWPRTVLERDGRKAWPAGTLLYLDHPTPTEEADRPERSVKDLAAKTTTDPVYESDGLYADVEVFPHAAALVESLADTIGLSVRGEGTGQIGTVGGRTGVVIESIDHGYSVDFVTRAGAGGKLVSLLEAARATAVNVRESRNIAAWIESRLHLALTSIADDMYGDGRLTRDERIALSAAVGDALTAWTSRVQADAPQLFQRDIYDEPEPDEGTDTAAVSEAARRLREATTDDIRQALNDALCDAYPGDANQWLWVRDYDADKGLVWYDLRDDEDVDTWQEGYNLTASDTGPPEVTLAGDRVQVIARTVYEPAPAEPDEPTGTAVGESAPPTSVTDGAPPTGTQPIEETSMSGTQNTGPAPGAAGTAEGTAAVPTAVAEAERAQALAEQQRDTALAEAEAGRRELARYKAVEAARPIATTVLAESGLPEAAKTRVLTQVTADVPLTEADVLRDGAVSKVLALDEAAFKARVTEAVKAEEAYVASLREAAGEGRVTGLGGNGTAPTGDTKQFETNLAESFKRLGMNDKAAALAAGGRH